MNDRMGNTSSSAQAIKQLEHYKPRDYFTIDRVISPTITIGVTKAKDSENNLSRQGIRFAEHGPIHRLQSFKEFDNCLEYKFEENVALTLCKVKEDVLLTLKTPVDGAFVTPVNESIRKRYKRIDMGAEELDQIAKIMK